jgi:hypothetical protein
MTKIGLLSDTHSTLPAGVQQFLKNCDEIWHAGDWGSMDVHTQLSQLTPKIRGVYGNIDGPTFSPLLPENQLFNCENVKILITHIGGYPGRYESRVKKLILQEKPQLYIAGHSHILKAIFDKKHQCLHLNPGAAGTHGFHRVITAMRFDIDDERITNLEIYELDRKKAML